ncbi:flagellar hook-associated protein 2 [Oceanobacillus chungangensis]|uniref:Flagellar hook-associated protein 2 n=1 Tax=Oceanobacillus chungangensis TaxID=1229152 RepID=A0A3D8PHW1_9BACI|nr:flagellar hook-associated protein 2 [Oceanobacillus chungangensis]RDW15670.1 flagellar hook protein [Oceanobacillus chungangensis]
MRIGGLASGIDTDNIIKELMAAERMPLDKMEQNKTKYEWQRDAFRDINTKIAEFDKLILDMKMSKTYETKKVSSSQESAVTATGSGSAMNGTYNIEVTQMASSAMRVANLEIDPTMKLSEIGIGTATYSFSTYDKDGQSVTHEFEVKEDDTLNDVMKRINADKTNNVRMFYDEQSNQLVMETTRTGDFNKNNNENNGGEIKLENNAFFSALNLVGTVEIGGENAKFKYNNGVELESTNNNYTLNGITFEFKSVTNGAASLNVTSDTGAAVKKITEFVEKYNELVDALNGTQTETKYRDYPPLTDEQREEMSEKEIELWEEKAKSGLLKGESIVTTALFDMRSGWYEKVENDGAFSFLSELGITTTRDYLDGGKLEIDQTLNKDGKTKLEAALESDPASVQKLFSNSGEGTSRGLLNRLEDALDQTVSKIEERAGKGTSTLENYTLGKRMKSLDEQIAAFEDRLTRIEDRYWRQFTAMEQAISMMNNQSAMLMSFGGGM